MYKFPMKANTRASAFELRRALRTLSLANDVNIPETKGLLVKRARNRALACISKQNLLRELPSLTNSSIYLDQAFRLILGLKNWILIIRVQTKRTPEK